jgi:hypothetical protein
MHFIKTHQIYIKFFALQLQKNESNSDQTKTRSNSLKVFFTKLTFLIINYRKKINFL